MAPGSDPLHIRRILLHLSPLVAGLSLCGAGAGGFGVLLLRRTSSASQVQALLDDVFARDCEAHERTRLSSHRTEDVSSPPERWTVHDVRIDRDGVQTDCLAVPVPFSALSDLLTK